MVHSAYGNASLSPDEEDCTVLNTFHRLHKDHAYYILALKQLDQFGSPGYGGLDPKGIFMIEDNLRKNLGQMHEIKLPFTRYVPLLL